LLERHPPVASKDDLDIAVLPTASVVNERRSEGFMNLCEELVDRACCDEVVIDPELNSRERIRTIVRQPKMCEYTTTGVTA
jgi:hypothetical protein